MTLHYQLRKNFEQAYYDMTEQAYYWTAKDAKHLSQLIKKLEFSFKQKNGHTPSENEIESSFNLLLEKLPEWYKNHFEVAIINSQYNQIIQAIKQESSFKDLVVAYLKKRSA